MSSLVLIVVCVLLGILLVALETLFVGGIMGILGSGFLIYAFWLTTDLYGWLTGLGVLCLTTVFIITLLFFIITKTRLKNKIVSHTAINATSSQRVPSLVGKTGITLTELCPSGKVEIEGKIYDAFSQKGFIAKDTPVIVESENTFQLFVKKT